MLTKVFSINGSVEDGFTTRSSIVLLDAFWKADLTEESESVHFAIESGQEEGCMPIIIALAHKIFIHVSYALAHALISQGRS